MMEMNSPSKTFVGVRFVLLGFNPLDERKVRSKLVDGGGVDLGQYSPNCTHVIVEKMVYDDPICLVARTDGKTLVTGLWVDHSFDIGMPVDATSVMYRPPRDLNGISGAKSLIICLTGYQRQDREDIMTMVSLMGAQFSKPLVANKVTHLICYKFEGEKYELARRMERIKLVNHRWLEDCLRDWELLPEANYDKSGYELETTETSAKDSEDEAEDATAKQQSKNKTPLCLRGGIQNAEVPKVAEMEAPVNHPMSNVLEDLSNTSKDMLLTPGKVNSPFQSSTFNYINAASYPVVDPLDETPKPKKVGNDLGSTIPSTKRIPLSAAKVSPLNHSMKTPKESPASKFSEASLSLSGSSKMNVDGLKATDAFDAFASKMENATEGSRSVHLEEQSSILPQKRAIIGSASSSKSQKTDQSVEARISRSPTANYKMPELEHDLLDRNDNPLVSAVGSADHRTVAHKLFTTLPTTNSPSSNEKSMHEDIPVLISVTSETAQDEIKDKNTTEKSEPVMEKSSTILSSESFQGLKDKPATVQLRKKTVAKKTLGARAKVTSSASQKGSIFTSKTASKDKSASCMSEGKTTATEENANQLKKSPPTVHAEPKLDITKQIEPELDAFRKIHSTDYETDAPEVKDDPGSDKALNEDKLDKVDLAAKTNTKMEVSLGDHKGKDDSREGRSNDTGLEDEKNESEPRKAVCSKKSSLAKGRKRNSRVAKARTSCYKETENPEKDVPEEKNENGKDIEMREIQEKEFRRSESDDQGNSTDEEKENRPFRRSESDDQGNSADEEKENRPSPSGDENSSMGEPPMKKAVLKSTKTATKSNKKSRKVDSKAIPGREVLNDVKNEPKWFIVSGHRLQRKEYQQVIKSLKGKCCRDTHQWSYQATHFIATEIRRTEKFFAAAASGRWILKSDYLTACSEAGYILPEEPYEWHKNGLSEDGAINLEAPRKWRLLREKTGHGAFYGMRIVVYGDCIMPSLDTLKRVVKAGDGAILATSPPYSRFLDSNIDFAIISPGMPRVDIWIQEFIRHEIPCVLADYLVEYVCKPGYSLDRHVLYNTNVWAEKSFQNLQRRAEEVADDKAPSHDSDSEDIACKVCGSRERGEVMLICGDEKGSTGCGIGTHIDCCDPPLEKVPESDWFCLKCSKRWGKDRSNSLKSSNLSKKRKKGASSSLKEVM